MSKPTRVSQTARSLRPSQGGAFHAPVEPAGPRPPYANDPSYIAMRCATGSDARRQNEREYAEYNASLDNAELLEQLLTARKACGVMEAAAAVADRQLRSLQQHVEKLAGCMGLPAGAGLNEIAAEIQKHPPWSGVPVGAGPVTSREAQREGSPAPSDERIIVMWRAPNAKTQGVALANRAHGSPRRYMTKAEWQVAWEKNAKVCVRWPGGIASVSCRRLRVVSSSMELSKDIVTPARQGFDVKLEFHAFDPRFSRHKAAESATEPAPAGYLPPGEYVGTVVAPPAGDGLDVNVYVMHGDREGRVYEVLNQDYVDVLFDGFGDETAHVRRLRRKDVRLAKAPAPDSAAQVDKSLRHLAKSVTFGNPPGYVVAPALLSSPAPSPSGRTRAPTDTALARTPLYVRRRASGDLRMGRVMHVEPERAGFTGGCYRVHWADGCVSGYPGADLVMVDETGRDL